MASTTPAETAIRETIARDGPITFRRFMEMALYTAPGAYYSSEVEKIGPGGDYFTSPEVHPSFSALLARQLEQLWIAMGRIEPFTVVEMGAGRGSLARDLLTYTARWVPSFHQAIAYRIVERSAALTRLQRETLAAAGEAAGKVTWHQGSIQEMAERSVEGCVLSNELLDAFPVHRIAVVGGELKEIYVTVVDGRLADVVGDLSDPRIAAYFDSLGLRPPEGCRAEVNLEALEWMAQVARALRHGAVLTLDYGYPAEELYSQRHCDGTLLCFFRHTLNSDPFVRIGRQDITTHVDFTSLAREGGNRGLQPVGLTTQRSALSALGMGGYLAALDSMGLPRREHEANWVAMEELMRPDGLGRVQLLIQQKGLEGFEPATLRPEGLRPGELGRDLAQEPVPLLTPSHMPLTSIAPMEPMMDEEGMWRELMGEEEDE
ncbi:MAG: class I SAM-dependent methyltransferase [Chloroflexota bacterium]